MTTVTKYYSSIACVLPRFLESSCKEKISECVIPPNKKTLTRPKRGMNRSGLPGHSQYNITLFYSLLGCPISKFELVGVRKYSISGNSRIGLLSSKSSTNFEISNILYSG
jgi:hypothetical protein